MQKHHWSWHDWYKYFAWSDEVTVHCKHSTIKHLATIAELIVGTDLKFSLKVGEFKYSSLESFEQLSTWRRRAFVLVHSWHQRLTRRHKEHAIRRLVTLNDLQLVDEKCNVALQMLLFHLQTLTTTAYQRPPVYTAIHRRTLRKPEVTGQRTDTPARRLPTRGLDISRTGQLAD